jgi:hypothetical protein
MGHKDEGSEVKRQVVFGEQPGAGKITRQAGYPDMYIFAVFVKDQPTLLEILFKILYPIFFMAFWIFTFEREGLFDNYIIALHYLA